MTPAFLTELEERHVGPGRKQLLSPLSYRDGRGRVWTVPAGFISDGASVPRALWWLYPAFGGAYEPAAWVHDYVYACAEYCLVTDADGSSRPLNRGEADGLLHEGAIACGFRSSGARAIYLGVRAGGWLPWRRYRQAATRLTDAVWSSPEIEREQKRAA